MSPQELIGESDVPRDFQMAREMGEQSADITTLKKEVTLLRQDVAEIKNMIAMSKGSWRTLYAVGSVAAAISAVVTAFVSRWLFR